MKRTLPVCTFLVVVAGLGGSAAAQPITLSSATPYRLMVDPSGRKQAITVYGTNFENEGHTDRDEYMHWQVRRDDGGWQRCGLHTSDCTNTGWSGDSETFAISGRFLARPGFIELKVFRGLGNADITDPSQAAYVLSGGWSTVIRIPVVSPSAPPKINALSKSTFLTNAAPGDYTFMIDGANVDPSVAVVFRGDVVVHFERILDGHLVQISVPDKYRMRTPGQISITLRTDRGGESAPVSIKFVDPPKPPVVGKPGLSGGPSQAGALAPQAGASLAVTKAPTPVPGSCLSGFVWRQAIPADHVCVSPDHRNVAAKQNADAAMHRMPNGGPSGPDTCLPGFVWRDAFANDHVCVTPADRAQAADDNRLGPSRTVK